MLKQSPSSIVWRTAARLPADALTFVSLGFRTRSQLAAEHLFLRKQLALYQERRLKPRRADNATRITLVVLSKLTD
jgi:putative transposase